MKIIKKILKIILIIVVAFFILLLSYSVYDLTQKREYNYKEPFNWIKVEENHINISCFPSFYMHTWKYKYNIKNRKLYIVLYQHSILNIFVKQRICINIDIDKGYNDFDDLIFWFSKTFNDYYTEHKDEFVSKNPEVIRAGLLTIGSKKIINKIKQILKEDYICLQDVK